MKRLEYLLVGVALTGFAVSLGKVTDAAGGLMRAWEPVDSAAVFERSMRGVMVRSHDSSSVLDLGSLARSVVFVFGPNCRSCNFNVANWMTLLAELRSSEIGALAVGFPDVAATWDYWSPVGSVLSIFVADSANLVRAGLRGTPTTLLIVNGRVRSEYVGLLSDPARQALLKKARAVTPAP